MDTTYDIKKMQPKGALKNKTFNMIVRKSPHSINSRNTLYTQTTDDEFKEMEKRCQEEEEEELENISMPCLADIDLLENESIPDFNDTLEEVDFILQRGQELKEQGKINFPSPRYPIRQIDLHATGTSTPQDTNSPKNKLSRRISDLISPITTKVLGNINTTFNTKNQTFKKSSPACRFNNKTHVIRSKNSPTAVCK